MSENTETKPGEEQRALTPEEIKEHQKRMMDWYKSQIPFLKVQKEYETLCADIEKARFEGMMYTMRQAQLMAGPPKETPVPPVPETANSVDSQPGEDSGSEKKRSLRNS